MVHSIWGPDMLKPAFVAAALALAIVTAQPAAAAYSCAPSADGKSIIVRVTNADDFKKSCSINCHFKIPGGSASVSCSKTVPASVKDWEMCVRSTGGDKYTFREGSEDCVKQ